MSIDGFGEPIKLTVRPDWWPTSGVVRWSYNGKPYHELDASKVINFGGRGDHVLVRLPADHSHYRNVATPAPKYPDALVELARDLAKERRKGEVYERSETFTGYIDRAVAIVAELSAEVDADLEEAREIASGVLTDARTCDIRAGRYDGHPVVEASLAAIKRGRALADADAGRR